MKTRISIFCCFISLLSSCGGSDSTYSFSAGEYAGTTEYTLDDAVSTNDQAICLEAAAVAMKAYPYNLKIVANGNNEYLVYRLDSSGDVEIAIIDGHQDAFGSEEDLDLGFMYNSSAPYVCSFNRRTHYTAEENDLIDSGAVMDGSCEGQDYTADCSINLSATLKRTT